MAMTAETIEKAARAAAIHDDHDGCFLRVDEYEALLAQYPDDYQSGDERPDSDYEDCEWWRDRVRPAIAAVRDDLVAEALAPIRALVDAELADDVASNIRAARGNVRCLDCRIRYDERDQYSCGEPGYGHGDGFTDEMLAEAEAEGRAEPVEYVTLSVADLLALLPAAGGAPHSDGSPCQCETYDEHLENTQLTDTPDGL